MVDLLLEMSNGSITGLVVGIVLAVVVVIVFFAMVPMSQWFRALVSGAPISMAKLVGMRLRKIRIGMIVDAYITGKKAGLDININELETHYMAKGDVIKVVNALISAHSANIDLSTKAAMAINRHNMGNIVIKVEVTFLICCSGTTEIKYQSLMDNG